MASFKNMDRLLRKLESLGGNVDAALERGVKQTTALARATAVAKAPASAYSQADSAGGAALKGSIQQEVKKTESGWEGRVYSNAPHAVKHMPQMAVMSL